MPDVQLRLLVLKTHQLDRLLEFYSTLGIRFTEEQHGSGPVHHSGQVGDLVLELYPLPEGQPTDSSTRLGFSVPDLEEALRAFSIPRDKALGVVRDPDGRAVELSQA